MRGRKPKPTYLRAIEGTADQKRHQRPDEPQPERDLLVPPHHLTEVQKDLWRCALATVPEGLLKEIDSSTFEAWIVARSIHAEAAGKVATLGLLVRSPVTNTPMQNPYVSIMNKQAQIMLKAAAEMGFTPSSRTRVKISPRGKGQKTGSPFGDLKSITED